MFASSLTKTLTAGVLAATLALTSLAPTQASAQISDEDAVVGLIALLLLGAAIHDRNRSDPAPVVVEPPRPRGDWRVLPAQCRVNVTTRRGNNVRMFGQRCLNNNYRFVDRLPEDCHIRVRTDNGQRRQGYRARCLRNQGFRVNRR